MVLDSFLDKFYSVGWVDPDGLYDQDELDRDSLDYAGRFFLVVYNTSATVSASYATFIVLAISFALAAVFGLLYYSIATGAASSGLSFGRKKKRSIDDEEERQRLLLQILELISNAEGHRLFIRNLVKSKEDKTPCLLQRLCSNYYNFKLSKNGKIQELMKQYSEFSRESSVELNEAISGQRCHERFKCQF